MSTPASRGPISAPFGTWKSPISALMIARMSVSIEDVLVDPVTSAVYRIEKRPEEDGRNVIVSVADNLDVFGQEWNARTAVHEYGGAAAIVHNNIILFSNLGYGQVYKVNLAPRSAPIRITGQDEFRFADFTIHPAEPNLVVCISEDHTKPAPKDVLNSLVCLNTNSAEDPVALLSGSDFYSSPRFNADGTVLAWTEWMHPDMPWDGFSSLRWRSRTRRSTDMVQCQYPHVFVRYFWLYNPWVATVKQDGATTAYAVESRPVFVDPLALDFADPSWWLGGSNFAVLDDSCALFAASKDGRSTLYIISTDGSCSEIDCPYVHIVRMRRMGHRKIIFLGSQADKGPGLVLCSFEDPVDGFTPTYVTLGDDSTLLDPPLTDSFISRPVPMSLMVPGNDSPELLPLHLIYYPPKNPLYKGLVDENPPAIINVHGGPTSLERQNLNLAKQDRLKGNWGVYDVHDCVQAALQLSSSRHDLIDRKRVVIRGGSAGGYTTLVALCQSDSNLQVFAAGASSYGISDLRKLTEFTHKFQSWYAQTLVGGTYDEIPEVYRARSPVFHAHNIKVPLLGSVDPIVPPNQAEDMIKVIREHGGSAEYVVFDGESHGWHKAENIAKALEVELNFYERALDLL
ncbi:alpha/beta-hydrolase [Mycena galericulata]|nr:alpha/beta-hydrolase [Mycena galericulata]